MILLTLNDTLFVLILEQSSLLQGWVWFVLEFQETSDDAADVSDIVTVFFLVEEELILEQTVLLLENCDF